MKTFEDYVTEELARARATHGKLANAWEGWSVLLEEVDEFWEEVKKKRENRSRERTFRELIQIAAMAQRMSEDTGTVPLAFARLAQEQYDKVRGIGSPVASLHEGYTAMRVAMGGLLDQVRTGAGIDMQKTCGGIGSLCRMIAEDCNLLPTETVAS